MKPTTLSWVISFRPGHLMVDVNLVDHVPSSSTQISVGWNRQVHWADWYRLR